MNDDQDYLNTIFNASSATMDDLPSESIHLCVTSPPYNLNKEYEIGQSFDDWLELCENVFSEVKRVLVPGGRVAIVVANTGRNPYIPLHYYLIGLMLDLKFLMRGEIVWNKGASVCGSCSWGSWMSATNPALRDIHEYVLVFSKDLPKRLSRGIDTINRDDFLACTKSIWSVKTVLAKNVGHPCPFPLELVTKMIHLYSFKGDIVLDPFMGSGQTAIAALKTGRSYVGYEIMPQYCELAERRISEYQEAG